jgi:Pvc16 N-terminal domain
MSADAIARVTVALQNRLANAIAGPVYVGPPIPDDVGARTAALFLFHVVPNQALRNEPHYVARPSDPAGPLVEAPALPLDLRFLVSVFRTAGSGGGGVSDPDELRTLGLIVQALHERPFIDGTQVPDQLVGITPEPYPMEELSRVWALFPQTSYRTSMVYLLSPVSVAVPPPPAGPPVVQRTSRQGPLVEGVAP